MPFNKVQHVRFPFQHHKQRVNFSKEGLSVSACYIKGTNLVHNTTEKNETEMTWACLSENATNNFFKKSIIRKCFFSPCISAYISEWECGIHIELIKHNLHWGSYLFLLSCNLFMNYWGSARPAGLHGTKLLWR